MRRIIIMTILLAGTFGSLFSQAPEAVNFQTIVRDNNGTPLREQLVSFRLSILQGGTTGPVVFSERHQQVTTQLGTVTLGIGTGTVLSGSFQGINWGANTYFLKTETDVSGGEEFITMGTTQLISVPYSLYAKNAGNGLPAGTSGQTLRNNGSGWIADAQLYEDGTRIGIGTTTPDNSSLLDVKSTSRGFLPPRMTTVQQYAISSPAEGLMVYNTDQQALMVYCGSAKGWINPNLPLISKQSCGITYYYQEVISPVTGKRWLDRNLGASRAAQSVTDYLAYGSLYQWGRLADGHQCINYTGATAGAAQYGTTTTTSSSNTPANNLFIRTLSSPFDWRVPQNNSLWQGVSGINNPCPSGYRIPTSTELENERLTWSSNNAAGAFASMLKFTMPGYRDFPDGALYMIGTATGYWSSTVNGINAYLLWISTSNDATVTDDSRAAGYPVRCIKE